MVRPRRFERLTYSFGGCCSIQLSYGRPWVKGTPLGYHGAAMPRTLLPLAAALTFTLTSHAQTASGPCPTTPVKDHGQPANGQPLASPAAQAETQLGGKTLTIHYNAPSVRCRSIMGNVVPYGQVWRTGANPATSFTTATDLTIGTLDIPAGKYTLYTLPAAPGTPLAAHHQQGNRPMGHRVPRSSGPRPRPHARTRSLHPPRNHEHYLRALHPPPPPNFTCAGKRPTNGLRSNPAANKHDQRNAREERQVSQRVAWRTFASFALAAKSCSQSD